MDAPKQPANEVRRIAHGGDATTGHWVELDLEDSTITVQINGRIAAVMLDRPFQEHLLDAYLTEFNSTLERDPLSALRDDGK